MGTARVTQVIYDERERQAMRVAVENVPGISQVIDHLVYVEPMSGAAGMGLPPLRTA
jgi:hypothetical protein